MNKCRSNLDINIQLIGLELPVFQSGKVIKKEITGHEFELYIHSSALSAVHWKATLWELASCLGGGKGGGKGMANAKACWFLCDLLTPGMDETIVSLLARPGANECVTRSCHYARVCVLVCDAPERTINHSPRTFILGSVLTDQ